MASGIDFLFIGVSRVTLWHTEISPSLVPLLCDNSRPASLARKRRHEAHYTKGGISVERSREDDQRGQEAIHTHRGARPSDIQQGAL